MSAEPLTSDRERKLVSFLRQLVEDVVAGGDLAPLEKLLRSVYLKVDKAIIQCDKEAAHDPGRAAFFHASGEAYNLAMDAVEQMDEALDQEDNQGLSDGCENFAAAVARVDRLIKLEEEGTL